MMVQIKVIDLNTMYLLIQRLLFTGRYEGQQ